MSRDRGRSVEELLISKIESLDKRFNETVDLIVDKVQQLQEKLDHFVTDSNKNKKIVQDDRFVKSVSFEI